MEFSFNEEYGVYCIKKTGLVTKEPLIEFYRELRDADKLPRRLNYLIDARECIYKFDIHDLEEILNELRLALEHFDHIHEAILVMQPYETMIATLFSEGIKDPRHEFGVFSTLPAALQWLKR